MVTHGLAIVTAAATLALILFGGLVTNTGAALAVPDWPTTFGYNMFLYPWSRMVGGVFYEHSHRLIGAVVGLLTLGLAALLWRQRAELRWLGLGAVAAVIVQGVLGGLRVLLVRETLAIVHGCLAQAFFGLIVVIAFLTSSRARAIPATIDPSLRPLALLTLAVIYLQIVFGAFLTHLGRIDLHLTGALAVFATVPLVTAAARRSGDAIAVPTSYALLGMLGIQLLLGVGSFLARFTSMTLPGGQFAVLALPVAHRLAASALLGAAVVLAVRTRAPSLDRRTISTLRSAAERPRPALSR